ncbi:MAG TPA: C39 family peptidase [Solirubrobacterales bacterium]|jgi:uncharacterized protein YvpB
MSTTGPPPRTRRDKGQRRAAALAALALVAAAVGVAIGSGGGGAAPTAPPKPAFVTVELGGDPLAHVRVGELRRSRELAALAARVPAQRVEHVGKASITYAVDRAAVPAALRRAVREGGGTVKVTEAAIASRIEVPMIAQRLQDDCEVTALSMVLGYAGHPVGQLTLQRQVAAAKPLDPEVGPHGEEVWGDPSLGFVGRADGGGPAGGFGVYQGPIRALAQRHDLRMTDLIGVPPKRLYAALLAGHPVLAWVALSAGPYASWTSPAGKEIRINYGEHAVVLTGVDGTDVHVNDPLSGERLIWSKSQFEGMWAGLGHRALAA